MCGGNVVESLEEGLTIRGTLPFPRPAYPFLGPPETEVSNEAICHPFGFGVVIVGGHHLIRAVPEVNVHAVPYNLVLSCHFFQSSENIRDECPGHRWSESTPEDTSSGAGQNLLTTSLMPRIRRVRMRTSQR